ncbi:helix-turn-helix transcriptional regulator, partial [Pseudomonas aeruginosa]|nr:helix-turn-helix transcriptional regulator [Pseudomonas aeruginosa]
MDIDELIARRLAALRKERELTLAQLAERCAVSKAMISRIERNQSSPTASVLGRLAGGLGVALSELLGDAHAPA